MIRLDHFLICLSPAFGIARAREQAGSLRWRGLLRLGAILIMVLACSGEGPTIAPTFPQNGQPGEPPVWAVVDHLEYGDLVVYPEPTADWRSLLDMRLFEGFRPGMTFRQAKSQLGEPTSSGEDDRGPFWEYEGSLGAVRIAHELKGSVPFVRWWRLIATPARSDVKQVFHPSVSDHIPVDLEQLTVVVMNNRGSPGAFVRIEANRVTSIDWVNNTGSGGTRDEGQ